MRASVQSHDTVTYFPSFLRNAHFHIQLLHSLPAIFGTVRDSVHALEGLLFPTNRAYISLSFDLLLDLVLGAFHTPDCQEGGHE